ncbi:MAG: tetratricopeptide repeat protein [Robiginitomaculum sp.]|nr:tetratricopeptide repeat protein [Robiginitomaculum sp.]
MLRGFVIIFLLGLPGSVLAQETRYDQCMKLVLEQPLAAYEEGLAWQSEEGGSAARHCIASALLGLGELQRAAERLESLGYAPDIEDDGLRARIFYQSGEAFLQLGDFERAISSFDTGAALSGNDLELRLGKARALEGQEEFEQALTELNSIINQNPNHVLALTLRATILIQLQRLDDAGVDVNRVMALAPTELDVLLLRGQWREAKRIAAR